MYEESKKSILEMARGGVLERVDYEMVKAFLEENLSGVSNVIVAL